MTGYIGGRQHSRWLVIFAIGLLACPDVNKAELLGLRSALDAGAGDATPTGGGGGAGNVDGDGDGVKNVADNCEEVSNADQTDSDGDGWGDLCDNCPIVANVSQEPVECKGGAIGKGDRDGDGVVDSEDNCALVANHDQVNGDGDLFGDACDNCLMVANDDQANVDDDLFGDACDGDISNETPCAAGSTRASRLKANLYFVFDVSNSMLAEDIRNLNDAVKDALQGPDRRMSTPDDLVNHFNVGMATFPTAPYVDLCGLEPRERLRLRDDNSAQSLIRELPVSTFFGTPTAAALKGVLRRNLFVLQGEARGKRPAAVVLLTDGEPNRCGGQRETVNAARDLASVGVPVYVIAYKMTSTARRHATEVATAGSVDRNKPQPPLSASDSAGIGAAFDAIRSQQTSCSFAFEAQADANFDRVEVVLHAAGKSTKLTEGANGYTLNLAARKVELTGTVCATFKAPSGEDTASVELRVACKAQCEPMPEVCDFRDNNCDRNIDEGCSDQPPEVCNGLDDDGDGTVDEGCPTDID